jgi:hypothetical protein
MLLTPVSRPLRHLSKASILGLTSAFRERGIKFRLARRVLSSNVLLKSHNFKFIPLFPSYGISQKRPSAPHNTNINRAVAHYHQLILQKF